MNNNTLTVTDNRTGKSYEVPIENDTVRSIDFRQIKVNPDDFGMMCYDPSYSNTAACKSTITYIDGDQGILLYRGYPIEQLAEECSFLECAFLILYGELPTESELNTFRNEVMSHTMIHENLKKFMDGFLYDSHPMSMLASTVAALSTFYPDSINIKDPANRKLQMMRIMGHVPTLAAYCYRRRWGLPYNYPADNLTYVENLMQMLWRKNESNYKPNPVLSRALEVLFILHLDHEQNCSSTTMRTVGSSQADPYLTTSAAISALSGPLHGGANEAVLRMLDEIHDIKNIPAFIEDVKTGHRRLMGFGHRVYKNYDPRAKIIKRIADEVFEVTGRNPKLEIAMELERIALQDDYFVSRKLYPNVDFYSGIIYQAMGFNPAYFTVLFAIPRTPGWLAQWEEMATDKEQKIARPRQVYLGHGHRDFVPMAERQGRAVPA
jgi:citrate synthase